METEQIDCQDIDMPSTLHGHIEHLAYRLGMPQWESYETLSWAQHHESIITAIVQINRHRNYHYHFD